MSAVIAANIPQELRDLPQWVCWKLETKEGRPKPTKVPLTITGGYAKTTNPATWATFDECVAKAQERGWNGVGFVFSKDDPYVGMDFDGMSWAEVEPMVKDVLPAYAEISQSGNGVHVICKGKLPPGGRRKGPVECYEEGRYFAITGNHPVGDLTLDAPIELEDRTPQLAAWHALYLGGFLEPGQGAASLPSGPLSPEDQAVFDRVLLTKGGKR